ncbi:MAG: hypothetical protein RI996_326 [Candidatus Parcubacteria bacterium]
MTKNLDLDWELDPAEAINHYNSFPREYLISEYPEGFTIIKVNLEKLIQRLNIKHTRNWLKNPYDLDSKYKIQKILQHNLIGGKLSPPFIVDSANLNYPYTIKDGFHRLNVLCRIKQSPIPIFIPKKDSQLFNKIKE